VWRVALLCSVSEARAQCCVLVGLLSVCLVLWWQELILIELISIELILTKSELSRIVLCLDTLI
jgi:hypothetical protein